jgi:hypothetical protein
VKIDVEGMEYEVIMGGKTEIAQFRPIIYYETLASFRDIRGFDVHNQIFNMLKVMDYRHFATFSQGKIVPIENLDHPRSPNTLAIPMEKVAQILSARR